MKVTKLQLEDFELLDFSIVGILSNVKEYKLAFNFNKKLERSFFSRINNIDILIKKKEFSYIAFESYDKELDASIFLIKNKPEVKINELYSNDEETFENLFSYMPLFLTELKNYDYILKIDNIFKLNLILDFLNQSIDVQFYQPLEIKNKKSIRNLIF